MPPLSGARASLCSALFCFALSFFFILVAPGALVVLHRPSPGVLPTFSLDHRFVHPRLAGLAWIWAGLILAGSFASMTFLPYTIFESLSVPWVEAAGLATGAVATAPLIALLIFDRRPKPY